MSTRGIPISIGSPYEPLEALYFDLPDTRGTALVCHPYPLFTDTVQNRAVATLQRSARDAGLAIPRFNFRGVGQSAGSYGEGVDEIDDAEVATRQLLARHPGLPLTLMGSSLGSCVAGNLTDRLEAEGTRLAQLFVVAPSVERSTISLPTRCPLTVVQPEDDGMATSITVYVWSESLARSHELLWVAEGGHFFHGKPIDLKDLLLPRLQD